MPVNKGDEARLWQHIHDLRDQVADVKSATVGAYENRDPHARPELDAEVAWFIAVAEEWAQQRTRGVQ
jgi:hypothetical protein